MAQCVGGQAGGGQSEARSSGHTDARGWGARMVAALKTPRARGEGSAGARDETLGPHSPRPCIVRCVDAAPPARRCWLWGTASGSGASTAFTLRTARPPLTPGELQRMLRTLHAGLLPSGYCELVPSGACPLAAAGRRRRAPRMQQRRCRAAQLAHSLTPRCPPPHTHTHAHAHAHAHAHTPPHTFLSATSTPSK